MRYVFGSSVCCCLLFVAAPSTGQAEVLFTDAFSSGSTLNSTTPAAPTAHSTSYQLSSSKTWAPAPSLAPGDLKFGIGPTTSGGIELQALFTTTPVSLVQPGDFIRLTVTFTNAVGLQTANCLLGFGLYNASQVPPLAGGLNATALNSASDKVTGGVQLWKGYWGQRGFTGQNSRILKRLEQTAGADNRNQNLTSTGSSSQSYGNPAGATVGTQSTAPSGALVVGNTYTVVLRIDLIAENTLAITNTYFDGPNTSGAVVSEFGAEASGTDFFTSSFDAIGIGWRAGASTTGGTVVDISSIVVDGSATPVVTPPEIVTQPVSVTVPSGGSCSFSVVAQGFGLTYQWHRHGTNLVDGGSISGATSSMLVISPASAADVASGADGYYVTVSGAGGLSTPSVTCSLTMGTASSLVWSGSSDTWDLGATPAWLKGGASATFNYGDTVVFDDTGAANLLVTLAANYLSAAMVTVDASPGVDYIFSGPGSFAGNGSLLYRGAGLLTINNANTFTRGTVISNSSAFLVLGSYSGLGAGPVTFAQAGATLEIVPAGSAANGIRGDVIVQEDCTIQFDAAGSYAAVFLGNLAGTPGKTLTLNPFSTAGPARIRVYGTETTCDANLVLNGADTTEAAYYGTTLAPYHSKGMQLYSGVISGPGGIIQRASGLTVLAGQNAYSGGTTPTTGTIGFGADSIGNVTSGPIGTGPLFLNPEQPNATGSGSVLAYGGARTIANPIQYASGTNNLTLIIAGTNKLTFSGPYTLNGNDGAATYANRVLQVNNTALTTFSGPISGSGFGLIKTGNGILALSGDSTYDGPTAVSNGTLRITGTLGSPVTVSAAATLEGNGALNGAVSLLAGGTLAPGAPLGTLTVNNSLTLAGNLLIELNKSASPASDNVQVSGALANTGTGTITVTNLGPALAANDSFVLFNKAMAGGDALAIVGAGVIWTNRLAVDGTIAVVTVIPTTPPTLSHSLSGNNLTLSWPLDYWSWLLQSNSVTVADAAAWHPVPGSQAGTQVVIPITPSVPASFFRLTRP